MPSCRDLLRPIRPPPERHQVEVHGLGPAPRPGVRMLGQPVDPPREDTELPHLGARALRVARPGPDQVHEVPRLVAVRPVAHRHRRPRQSRHDPSIEVDGVRGPLEDPQRQVPRARRIAQIVLLGLGTVALARRTVARGARVGVPIERELARRSGERRRGRHADQARPGLAFALRISRGGEDPGLGGEALDVVDERPALLLRQVAPRGHRRPGHAAGDGEVEILVGRHALPRRHQAVVAGREVPRLRVEQVCGLAGAASGRAMTGRALPVVDALAEGQELR